MSTTAFASSSDPYVTVYITSGMFTLGGFDYNNNQPIYQTYDSSKNPANNMLTGYIAKSFYASAIPTAATQAKYLPSGTTLSYSPNVLDAAIYALMSQTTSINCGWDSYNAGGYINSFTPNGTPTYGPTYTVTINGVTYTVYSGKGIQIACTQGGTISGISSYATNYALADNMVIVVDISPYVIFYP